MKTSELTGAHLDYWVARAEGIPAEQLSIRRVQRTDIFHCVREWMSGRRLEMAVLPFSTDWAYGGPLIDKYSLDLFSGSNPPEPFCWAAYDGTEVHEKGDTPLKAICRAVVRAAFGDEVEEVAVC